MRYYLILLDWKKRESWVLPRVEEWQEDRNCQVLLEGVVDSWSHYASQSDSTWSNQVISYVSATPFLRVFPPTSHKFSSEYVRGRIFVVSESWSCCGVVW